MTDPARANQLWLVLTVATFAVVRLDGAAENNPQNAPSARRLTNHIHRCLPPAMG